MNEVNNLLGRIKTYTVDRETNLGYTLIYNDEEYFLHHNECNGKSLTPFEKVNAFMYIDKKGRPALTLYKPLITIGDINFLEVVSVKNDLGVFCNIGISKDILLSKDDLPRSYSEWPKVGDKIICELKIKFNKLQLKIASKNYILAKKDPNNKYLVNEYVHGNVYRISPDGISFVTEDFNVIFVFKTNYRNKYHLGEVDDIKIIDVHEEDYTGTLIKNKEEQISDDKERILNYLKNNNGVMLITDKSSPELINYNFHMSKKSFKNSLGSLFKDGLIEILDDKIILNIDNLPKK